MDIWPGRYFSIRLCVSDLLKSLTFISYVYVQARLAQSAERRVLNLVVVGFWVVFCHLHNKPRVKFHDLEGSMDSGRLQ